MKNAVQMTRRTFLKATGLAAGYILFGFNLTKEAIASTMEFAGLRQKAVYEADASSKVYKLRKSQDNPMVQKIYDKKQGFLADGPCGHKSHELLHTHYHDRSSGVKAVKAAGTKLKV
jgi:ferredoxin hydrogenase small subunit